jgi:DNA-binding GntR family transcriptional regulator
MALSLKEEAAAHEGRRKGDAIYQALKRQLLRGEYELGAALSVVDLAESVGASRQPVMEALKRLESEGFVRIIPQVGCRVVTPTTDEVRDFYEVFATMEGLVSRFAAERREPGDIEELKRASDALSLGAGSFDSSRYAELNRAFHGLIHRCAKSRPAREAAEMYWDRSDFLIASTRPPFWQENVDHAQAEHEGLRDAVVAGAGKRAQKLAYEHIRSFGDAVADHVAHHGSGS